MSRHISVLGGALALNLAMSSIAIAQEESYLAQHVRAPSNALELNVGTGYTQGFGNLSPGRSLPNVAGAGVGVSGDIDYRLSPWWSLGVEGQYQQFTPEQNSQAKGVALNIGATYHFAPMLRGDPWVRLGTGYRWVWENDIVGTNGIWAERDGFQLATGKIGYDVRVSEDVAIAPVIGADVNTFFWEQYSNGPQHSLSSAQVATFVYAGLQGRFDIGGSRQGAEVAVAAPPQPVGVTAPQPAAPPPPVEETKPASPLLSVSEGLARQCQINVDSVEKAPKFDFNQSDLLPSDLAVLDLIAKCMTTGPMKDAKLVLVGRADPRGTIPYNYALGMRRAAAVSAYLEQNGVTADRIEQSTRGKIGAAGHDEGTWAVDRRVDLLEVH